MVTYWTTGDFASLEIYSFIRLNDAFRKTSLQAAKNEYKKLTNYENNFYRARLFQMK